MKPSRWWRLAHTPGRWARPAPDDPPGVPSVVQPEDGFLDVAAPSRGERGFHSDDLEARLLKDPQRGDIVAGRASVHRPDRHQVEKQRERPGRDAPPPQGAIDPVRDLRLAVGDKAGHD